MRIPQEESLFNEAIASYFERIDAGESVDESDLVARYPEFATELRLFLANQQQLDAKLRELSSESHGKNRLTIRCPLCHQSTEVAADSTLNNLTCSSCGSKFHLVGPSRAVNEASATVRMGRFALLERLGMGSFGSVWKAKDDLLDRFVAIKIPRYDAMSADEQEKFFREARAAAQLRHPNIVSVHEVGREGDTVYIVSDFVQGVTMADWSAAQQLTNREAAALCAKIAYALHHAHEQGIVHRDLKPANILMDADREPHIMDFGLARREVGEVTITMDGQVLGTPAYMSPEQALGEGHAADQRSDVYSLGVILFQSLTGELPFRGNPRMLLHQVINDEPPSPRKLSGNIKRDLETITLKCLEKMPERRYATANDLGDELSRFLRGEPILARPIRRTEQAIRWTRRNKRLSVFAATAALALVSGTIVSTYFAVRAEIARREADARRNESEAVTKFVVGAFKSPDPSVNGRKTMVVDVLDRAEKDANANLSNEPLTEAAILQAIGDSRIGLGLTQEALDPLEKANELRQKLLGHDHLDTIESIASLANAKFQLNDRLPAAELQEEVLALRRKKLGNDDPLTVTTMIRLAYMLRLNADIRSLDLCNEAIAARSKYGDADPLLLEAKMQLAVGYRRLGKLDQAIKIQEEVLATRRKLQDRGPLQLSMTNLAGTYFDAGRFEEAIALNNETIALKRERLGPDHPDTLLSMRLLATCYCRTGRFQDAIPIYEQVLAGERKSFGEHSLNFIITIDLLCEAYGKAGRNDDAIRMAEEGSKLALESLGVSAPYSRSLLVRLISLHADQKQIDAAVARFEKNLAATQAKYGEKDPSAAMGKWSLAQIYISLERPKDAIKLYEELLAANPKDHESAGALAKLLATTNPPELRDGKRAVDLATKACKLTNYHNPWYLAALAQAYAETGDFDAALKWSYETLTQLGPNGDKPLKEKAKKLIEQYERSKSAPHMAGSN